MKFKILGADLSSGDKPEVVMRAENYCQSLPNGSLVALRVLAAGIKRRLTYVQSMGGLINPALRLRQGRINLYGNPKTIKAYRKKYGIPD